jgi:hypothetical protein
MTRIIVGLYTNEGHDVVFEEHSDSEVQVTETYNGNIMPTVIVNLADAKAKQDQLSALGYQLV